MSTSTARRKRRKLLLAISHRLRQDGKYDTYDTYAKRSDSFPLVEEWTFVLRLAASERHCRLILPPLESLCWRRMLVLLDNRPLFAEPKERSRVKARKQRMQQPFYDCDNDWKYELFILVVSRHV